jgi:hypothetical protein
MPPLSSGLRTVVAGTVAGALSLATSAPRAQPEAPPPAATPAPRVHLRGVVYDGKTAKPVAGATWTADGVAVGKTAADGSFAVAVEPGAVVLLEHERYEVLLVDVAAAAVSGDQILVPLGQSGEVIELRGETPPAAAGAARLQRDELERMPGTGGDLLKGLDVLPGVTATSGFGAQNGLVIRGSAPEDSRILIDGFEVPLLYHSLAQRAILPTAAIAGIEYLPGGFDVAFGRASSGIVSVTTRGAGERRTGQAEVGLIDGGVVGQGPIDRDTRVLVAVRRSVIDLALPALLPSDLDLNLTTVPRYYDGQIRIDRKLSSRWRGSITALGATDTLELFADDEQDPDQRFYNDSRFIRLTAQASYYTKPWSATLAASGLIQGFTFELGREQYIDTSKRSIALRSELTRTDEARAGLRNVVTRLGAEVDVATTDLDLVLPQLPDEGDPDAGGGPGDRPTSQRFQGEVTSPNLASWLASAADVDPRIRVTAGLRVDAFVRSRDLAVQPRGEIAVRLAERSKLRAAAGAYRRPAENRDELLDDTLAPERSTQLVLGLEQRWRLGLGVQASIYYTDRSALLTRTMDGSYANQGRGESYGAELLATYRRGPWLAWLSYSYSHSRRQDAPGEEERRFDYDQPHDLNLVASWRRGPWQLGGRFQYTSGTPYTPVLGSIYESDDDRFRALYGATNTERLPGHLQLDLRVDRSWKWGRATVSAFLDVQNATANAKIEGYTYNYDYSERTEFTGLPILPSIGIRGEL